MDYAGFMPILLIFRGGDNVKDGRNTPGDRPKPSPHPPPPPPPPPIGDLTKTYFSEEQWSGDGVNWSEWYKYTSPLAPAGYEVLACDLQLVGDRQCGSWAECREVRRTLSVVTAEFRMQGHTEKFPSIDLVGLTKDGLLFHTYGNKATSRMALTVHYKKVA
jgi:hypothetical protein